MDIVSISTIGVFLVSIIINILSIGHFKGQSTQRLDTQEAMIREVHLITLTLKEEQSKAKTDIAVNTKEISSFNDDIKEIKGLIKDLSKEIKEIRNDFKYERSARA
jgi:predicted  nucleic acid-binding Zn-ribbon protein